LPIQVRENGVVNGCKRCKKQKSTYSIAVL
jgi:hypothetical protein